MTNSRDRLLGLLAERSYQEGEFTLASGKKASFYIDSKQVTMWPEGILLVGEAVWGIISRYNVGAVGGLTMGADPIATAVAMSAYNHDQIVPAFIVRKEPKEHGLRRKIEGPLPIGANVRVAVVDDVITSGSSVLKAIDVLESEGCKIAVVVGLIDRQEGGREKIEGRGYKFESVFTIDELRSVGVR